ncbi:putative exo-beta-1,3-glucanase [Phlyctema vagabunda]|uniref:glucan 1,3-beta-glucosidase n=1 Tax=Phlyctema vagabunda TaxID=108571 RepID=A0ABR4PRA4_9HELO
MWNQLPVALIAIVLLSNGASARWLRNRDSVTVTLPAFEATSTSSILDDLLKNLQNLNIPGLGNDPVVVMSTQTVAPVPLPTVSVLGYDVIPAGAYSEQPTEDTASSTPATQIFTPNPSVIPTVVATTPYSPSTLAYTPTPVPASPSTLIASVSEAPSPVVLPSATSTAVSSFTPIRSESSTAIPFLRGVNLGGWLILEKWMGSDAFNGDFSGASDQWSFDSIAGAEAALQAHWSTYFTEDDIKAIAATGINALRIPIGYWAYDNSNTPYIQGADAFLEQAIGWARNSGLKVWVDCHGSPGSQNGFDNSGHSGNVEWQSGNNLEQSISVLKTMAQKYGAAQYADVVVGLEMVNEPISWGSNDFSVTQSWAREAYAAVKSVTENENLIIVMHDSFVTPLAWTDLGGSLIGGGSKTFGLDTHLYQLWGETNNAFDQDQHITTACGWASDLATSNAVMPTYVGEWSTATNICVNPDGSTTAGTSCSAAGCQCQSADFDDWNDVMVSTVRKFVEAQLDVFESSSSGYFIWSAKGPGGWGFLKGIEKGTIPNPVTSRQFPSQCGGGYSQRRNERGSLVV